MAVPWRNLVHEFKKSYAVRAGIKGTVTQAAGKLDMRRSRYRGLVKTHFQRLITAAAINVKRVLAWLTAAPRSTAHLSHFVVLTPV